VGRARGALQSGGRVNLQKAAEIAIHDFRAHALGPVTLETPAEFALWLAEGQRVDAQRQIKKDAITQDRLIRHKKIPRPARAIPPDEPREPSD
jgi:ribosome biogenesis GTPase A